MASAQFSWITEHQMPDGRWHMTDERDGTAVVVPDEAARWAFIADHSSSRPGAGLGDKVHDALDWAGFRRCMPCAQRQAALNALSNWAGGK